MTNMTTVPLNMVITKIIDAPAHSVWRAWSEESLVKRWWGPRRFTAPLAKMDFKVGGKSWYACVPQRGSKFITPGHTPK